MQRKARISSVTKTTRMSSSNEFPFHVIPYLGPGSEALEPGVLVACLAFPVLVLGSDLDHEWRHDLTLDGCHDLSSARGVLKPMYMFV